MTDPDAYTIRLELLSNQLMGIIDRMADETMRNQDVYTTMKACSDLQHTAKMMVLESGSTRTFAEYKQPMELNI